ncbi:MAG: CAP domain-containing protein [Patescibacteria group bacterium]
MLIKTNFMKNLLRDLFIPCKENGFKPRILETQFFFILLGFLVGLKILTLVSFWGNFGATIFNQVSQDDLYVLTNNARASNGAEKLQISSKLEAAAQLKLADMFQNNYFAHTSPVGIEPWHWFDKANYGYKIAGENLAMSFMSSDEVLKAWLNSETHRKNLFLSDFKETGIAVGSGMINGQQTVMVVQVFGTPITSALAIKTKPILKINPSIVPEPVLAHQISTAPKPPSLTPSPSLAPKPPSLTPSPIVRANPISLKKALAVVPQVKSAMVEKSFWAELGPFSYFANDSLKKIMILFSVAAVIVLFLTVFVSFGVQFPALILKSALLIVISLSFVLIKDKEFMPNRIQITDEARITISNAK